MYYVFNNYCCTRQNLLTHRVFVFFVRKSVISNQSSIYFVSNHINSVQYLYISGNSKAHPFRILLLMCNMDRIDYFQKKSTKLQLIWILKVIDYKLITSNFRSNQLHLITFPPCFQNYLWLLLITLPVFGFFSSLIFLVSIFNVKEKNKEVLTKIIILISSYLFLNLFYANV